jgi:dTDP-4-amino-4,6-dideoxygalactose transaminase
MSKLKLAINGGVPVRKKLFPNQNTIDDREINEVIKVMKHGRLSGYRGNWCPEFMGGSAVQELEQAWQKRFNVKHAIAINSATSGLHIACGALGIKPGEEVIVTPYSMTCSATAPMIYGGIPVFADIEKDYYCLDPKSVEEKITEKTKAIIVVSLFGQPYDTEINAIAHKHGLYVIEDAAQAVGSAYLAVYDEADNILVEPYYAGTLGDIGVYSFNYGKHMNCGEGGMLVTNNDELALRCQLIRNHAEAVINGMPQEAQMKIDPSLIGFNMRMTEINAAIIKIQLEKFNEMQSSRMRNVNYLNKKLSEIPAIEISKVRPNCTHTYYALPFQWNSEKADNVHRDKFIEAVKAELSEREGREGEGVPIGCGYIQPLYLMPLFQYKNNARYQEGICPVCEDLWQNKLFLTLYHSLNSTLDDILDVTDAFIKVWENKEEIKKH